MLANNRAVNTDKGMIFFEMHIGYTGQLVGHDQKVSYRYTAPDSVKGSGGAAGSMLARDGITFDQYISHVLEELRAGVQ